MLELQGDFGTLLRQTAFFEGVGELILLADAHQELRLREQRLNLHSLQFRSASQGGEVHVSRDVLFAGSFVRIRAN